MQDIWECTTYLEVKGSLVRRAAGAGYPATDEQHRHVLQDDALLGLGYGANSEQTLVFFFFINLGCFGSGELYEGSFFLGGRRAVP